MTQQRVSVMHRPDEGVTSVTLRSELETATRTDEASGDPLLLLLPIIDSRRRSEK